MFRRQGMVRANAMSLETAGVLYFASDRGGSMNLWRVAIDEKTGHTSGAPEPVTLPAAFAAHFATARETDALIYTSVLQTNAIERYVLDGADGSQRPVTIFCGSLPVTAFDVSPDGNRIAFAATNGSQEDLFFMNADGSQIQQITDDAEPDRGPAWAGDGTSLYFYSQRGARYEVYTIRPDGGGLTQITRPSADAINLPRPSPDGTRLVLAKTDGTILWDLRASRYESLPPPDAKHAITDARWSKDGRSLVALESPAGDLNSTSGIVLYDFNTKAYRRLGDDHAYALT